MKNEKLASAMLALFALSFLPIYAQSDKTELNLAFDVLKGKNNSKDKKWAVNTLQESQVQEKDAYVQNVLGIAYLHGLGVEPDTVTAIQYFEQSGTLGYNLAYHNLGMMYKYNKNGKPNYEKAFDAFYKGALNNNPTNCYNCGYMKYKGLGTEQDYEGAVKLFKKAADSNHASAMYMLGLCLRNGYGIEIDTAMSNHYLREASKLGQKDAMSELLNTIPENKTVSQEEQVFPEAPEEMPLIDVFVPNNQQNISGNYEGFMVTYDWSGKYSISEKSLSAFIVCDGNSLSGLWVQEKDTIPFSAHFDDNKSIIFEDTEFELYDRYSRKYKSKYRFDKIDMSYNNGYMVGQLRLYSLREQEPDRPMYFCLTNIDLLRINNRDNNSNQLTVYSMPNSDQIVLKFILTEEVPNVNVSFYSRTGINVLNYKYGGLNAGEQILSINPPLDNGYYSIKIMAGNQQFQSMIVK